MLPVSDGEAIWYNPRAHVMSWKCWVSKPVRNFAGPGVWKAIPFGNPILGLLHLRRDLSPFLGPGSAQKGERGFLGSRAGHVGGGPGARKNPLEVADFALGSPPT